MTLPRTPPRVIRTADMPTTGSLRYVPPAISKVEDTGLSQLWLQDLALKILYFRGYLTGFKVADAMALPFAGLTDQILEALKREKFVEVKSQVGIGEGSYQYAITDAGIARAREALDTANMLEPRRYRSRFITNPSVAKAAPDRQSILEICVRCSKS